MNRKRVLVVGGHLAMTCLMLDIDRLNAQPCKSAREVLQRLRTEGASAVVIDFDLAGAHDARELAATIRMNDAMHPCAILGASAAAETIDLRLVDVALRKPHVSPALGCIVRAAIQVRRRRLKVRDGETREEVRRQSIQRFGWVH